MVNQLSGILLRWEIFDEDLANQTLIEVTVDRAMTVVFRQYRNA